MGGLHIELAALKTLGDLLEGSGWTGALVTAKVASPGTADSFLKAAHITRTRRAHQITASSLYILLQRAYTEYCREYQGDELMEMDVWCADQVAACPHFLFWYTILHLELQMLIFIQSIREANLHLYIQALTKLVPWFFVLGHINYARWVSIHLRDMVALQGNHPIVYEQLEISLYRRQPIGFLQ